MASGRISEAGMGVRISYLVQNFENINILAASDNICRQVSGICKLFLSACIIDIPD